MTKGVADRIVADSHQAQFRVYYEDTDAGGIVYHANYLKFAERARTEMLRGFGAPYAQTMRENNLIFVVRQCKIDYRSPARLDDLITVVTTITAMGGASLSMQQNMYRDEDFLVEVNICLVCLDATGKVSRLPETIRSVLSDFMAAKH